jgi:acyl-CoA synthetase (AMP-forming)/AMP-acid ligase II
MTVKDLLRVNAFKWPDKIGIKDLYKTLTFKQWNERACRLANVFSALGLKPGDRFAVLAYNCIEWLEIYAAAAKGGFICVPVMFRLSPPEMQYILSHSDAKIFIVQDQLIAKVNEIGDTPTIEKYVSFGPESKKFAGYLCYEDLMQHASTEEPDVRITGDDVWVIMYTGGTTGRPKGVIKTHESLYAYYLIMVHEHGFNFNDTVLLVMPLCHINSLFYSFVCTYVGGTVMAYNMMSFDPEELLKTLVEHRITFTSLVPTHYIMVLALPEEAKRKYDVSCVSKLVCSSAPVRRDTKLRIMEYFKNSKLYEAYGSTEAGTVTVLEPEDALRKLGSIGREPIGSDIIKLIDSEGNEINQPNVVGELYSRSPMLFDGYWKDPVQTENAFKGDYFSAGDMGFRDEDGYYYLVDRKANMIISGGENVFPSEVENVVGGYPKVKDVAVIGIPHEKWGEQVAAVIVLHEGVDATEQEISNYCRGKIAGYKVPKKVIFIKDEEMPRSGAGKILHRVLREKYGMWKDHL